VVASITMLEFEVPAGGNIQTAEDAMWWAISTITTVDMEIGIQRHPKGASLQPF
jgi:hypothetical protein